MKKILLINPPFNIAKENYDSSISVGLLSIATFLKAKGAEVCMLDGVRQKDYPERLRQLAPQYDLIGLSVMTMQISNALRAGRIIRELNPSARIIWGGSHATFFPEQTIRHDLADGVCIGEGEEAMWELAQERPDREIKGLVFSEQGKTVINEPRPLADPAAMPLFDWDLVPEEIRRELYLIPTLTSRGCPHQCTFCINAILKNRWRPRSAEQVLDDIAEIRSKPYFQGKKIRFWDENFFVDIGRARAIINGMIERDLVMPWETTVRADYMRAGFIDDEFMARLKLSGCYLLSFGAESGSPAILKKIKKGITPDQMVDSARMCLRHGIIPQYSFMIGLPGESRSDMMMTLRVIDRLLKLSDQVQVLGPQAFRPYPGSELYHECLAAGWKAPESIDEWARVAENELSYLAVKNFPWVKEKDLVESMEAYVRFGAHSVKSAMGSTIKAQKWIKLGFVLLCQLRWRLKFFAWPIEFKLAKKFVTK